MQSLTPKVKYIDAICDLLKDHSIDEIRVQDICDKAGSNRQNFYYHFCDKYDLISYVYLYDLWILFITNDPGLDLVKRVNFVYTVKNKADIYKKLLQDTSQNSLLSYIKNKAVIFMKFLFEKNGQEIDTEIECLMHILVNGWIGSLIFYLDDPNSIKPNTISEFFCDITPVEFISSKLFRNFKDYIFPQFDNWNEYPCNY